jgi:V8-like Glu-specific endopeptidase
MIEEKSREEKKILNEELFRVDLNDLTNILHRSIVALTFLTPYKQYAVGTGFLISANLVLTAAHNLYEKRYNLENEDFKLYC